MFSFSFNHSECDTDVSRTISTSQQLNIAEFELFGLAWQEWYGTPASETELEQHFLPYIFQGQVPFWVRKFCLDLTSDPARCERFTREQTDRLSATPWQTNLDNNILIA